MPAIVAHHTATVDEPWDGPANVARCRSGETAAYYAKVFGWRDPDMDNTKKMAYKMPHHNVSEDGTPGAAVVAGCRAVIAALNGARMPSTIPPGDRQGVWNHAAAHLRDAGVDPAPLKSEAELRELTNDWLENLYTGMPGIHDLVLRARLQPEVKTARRPWYRFENATDADTAELWIYDAIDWLGITADQFVHDLALVTAPKLLLHLNTPGGDVFDGIAIYNALRGHTASVTVRIEGIAASIGSVIAMAGDRVMMAPHSTMMIHEASGMVRGPASDMRQMADILDRISNNIAGVYAGRAGGKIAEWRDRMLAETWLDDQEAVDLGLADEVDKTAPAATNHFDLSQFRHPPAALLADDDQPSDAVATTTPTKRDAEQALRDAGFSRDRAKALVANGWWGEADHDTVEERDAPSDADADDSGTETVEPVTPEALRQKAAARARELELYRLVAA